MTYKQLETQTRETATYPKELAEIYLTLGLTGELGEVCDKFKKLIRDDGWNPNIDPCGHTIPEEKKKAILLELGDLVWYIVRYSEDIGLDNDYSKEHHDIEWWLSDNFESTGIMYNLMNLKGNMSYGRYLPPLTLFEFINNIAHNLDSSFNEVCKMNYEKLKSRMERNKIGGSGDYR